MNWFETLKGLNESVLRQQLAENPISSEIAEVYSLALATKDVTIAVAAQDELLKRGDSDYVCERLMEACQAGVIELGDDFAEKIARSLMMVDSELDSVEREVDDETKEVLRDYGKYIRLSLANT